MAKFRNLLQVARCMALVPLLAAAAGCTSESSGGTVEIVVDTSTVASAPVVTNAARIGYEVTDATTGAFQDGQTYPIDAARAMQIAAGQTLLSYSVRSSVTKLRVRAFLQDAGGRNVAEGTKDLTLTSGRSIVYVTLVLASGLGGGDGGTDAPAAPDGGPEGDGGGEAGSGLCGNGKVDPGETCDPPESCPICLNQNNCVKLEVKGSAATCDLQCVKSPKQCVAAEKDKCCPIGCDGTNDADCLDCGDGKVDPMAGETCDPPSSCPKNDECQATACWEIKEFTGSPGTCNSVCTTKVKACSGTTADGCCPPGCNTSPENVDVDCQAECGNGMKETGEACDPRDPQSPCPTSCPAMGCNLFALDGGGTCKATCKAAGNITACANGDACCPNGCNAGNDTDCQASCGNNSVEAGEICDGNCPTTCPQQGCKLRKLDGADCARKCVDNGTQTMCAGGDGCCPTGCTIANDTDCVAGCGNGITESGETCDGNCPTECPPLGCQLRNLQDNGACNKQCVSAGTISICKNGDGCCPSTCNANNDSDCAPKCGNNVVESGELCDGACPSACAPIGCQFRALQGSGCQAQCVTSGTQTSCQSGDGCCPSNCNANNDTDCAPKCGNGVVESGEECDGNCPTSCPAIGCNLRALQGSGCQAKCVASGMQTTCQSGDGCCPAGCNANNDAECSATCGNGQVESGETCDGNCPTSCPSIGCQVRTLANGGTCQAQCVNGGTIAACANDDGCCPAGCNANNDNNCQPSCGNGVVESGELCDGNCPTSCPLIGCKIQALQNAGTCRAQCVDSGQTKTTCANNDGCCPGTCNANNDNDCRPRCGNNVIEAGETCDGNCPTCANGPCFHGGTGSAGTCDLVCPDYVLECREKLADQCCAHLPNSKECTLSQDPDCSAYWQWTMLKERFQSDGKACVIIPLMEMKVGGAYQFTSCVDPSIADPAVGAARVTRLLDWNGVSVTDKFFANTECDFKYAIPHQEGWFCDAKGGTLGFCSNNNTGGFILPATSLVPKIPVYYLEVCPAVAGEPFSVNVSVFYNATAEPYWDPNVATPL